MCLDNTLVSHTAFLAADTRPCVLNLAVSVNNTLVSHTAFLAADTRLCVLIMHASSLSKPGHILVRLRADSDYYPGQWVIWAVMLTWFHTLLHVCLLFESMYVAIFKFIKLTVYF